MIGVAEVAEAAKRELGEGAILKNPVRVSCPSCGSFAASTFTVPVLLKVRCGRCKMDVVALVGREGAVLAVTEKA